MPNKQSAYKALRQSKKRTSHNKLIKSQVEIAIRQARKVLAEPKQAAEAVKLAIRALDKATQKKVLKANTAARRKSRLMAAWHKTSKA